MSFGAAILPVPSRRWNTRAIQRHKAEEDALADAGAEEVPFRQAAGQTGAGSPRQGLDRLAMNLQTLPQLLPVFLARVGQRVFTGIDQQTHCPRGAAIRSPCGFG